ncbi:MAG: hypothetical protein HON90_06875 [Halobacteriovoraceae bacterium]|jgi:hypothetical protein|nr:hypothetical protein [Halobacteriovoraceae bacterium]
MIIKVLYVLAIFLIVRFVVNQIKKIQILENKRNEPNPNKMRENHDYVDAEFTELDDK